MRFNWIDAVAIGTVSLVAGIQFLRGIRDFSLVFYETVFFIIALIGANKFFSPIHNLTGWSYVICFLLIFGIFAILGIILASILNLSFEFGLGTFNYFFGFLLGIACGFVFGHTLLKSLILGYNETKPDIVDAIHHSWVASQVLYFGAFREFLGLLRIARYHNI